MKSPDLAVVARMLQSWHSPCVVEGDTMTILPYQECIPEDACKTHGRCFTHSDDDPCGQCGGTANAGYTDDHGNAFNLCVECEEKLR